MIVFDYISPALVAGTAIFAGGFFLLYKIAESHDKKHPSKH